MVQSTTVKQLGKSILHFHPLMYFRRLRNIGRGYRNIHLMRKMGRHTIFSFEMGILPNTFTAIKLFPTLEWLMKKGASWLLLNSTDDRTKRGEGIKFAPSFFPTHAEVRVMSLCVLFSLSLSKITGTYKHFFQPPDSVSLVPLPDWKLHIGKPTAPKMLRHTIFTLGGHGIYF